MGYIDTNLLEGEQVVYRTNLHWIIYSWTAVWLLFGIWLAAGKNGDGAIGGFCIFIALIIGALTYADYKCSEFGVTNKRVMIKVGIIRRVSLETLLIKVEGIQVDQGLLGRIFNYGTIIVTGTGGTHSPFKRIAAPMDFRKKIQEQISLTAKA